MGRSANRVWRDHGGSLGQAAPADGFRRASGSTTISLDAARLGPIPTNYDKPFDALLDFQTALQRLSLAVKVSLHRSEYELRFNRLPGAIVQCMDDLETDLEIGCHNFRAEERLRRLAGRLVPGLGGRVAIMK